MRVVAGQTDPRKCTIHPEDAQKLLGVALHEEVQLRVLTYDKLGNRRESGDGDAHASCTLDDAEPGCTTAVIEGEDCGDGVYVLRCIPLTTGNGFVFVRFDGDLVCLLCLWFIAADQMWCQIADQPMHCSFGIAIETSTKTDTTFLTTTF